MSEHLIIYRAKHIADGICGTCGDFACTDIPFAVGSIDFKTSELNMICYDCLQKEDPEFLEAVGLLNNKDYSKPYPYKRGDSPLKISDMSPLQDGEIIVIDSDKGQFYIDQRVGVSTHGKVFYDYPNAEGARMVDAGSGITTEIINAIKEYAGDNDRISVFQYVIRD